VFVIAAVVGFKVGPICRRARRDPIGQRVRPNLGASIGTSGNP
jgi:hypothetical protein